MHDPAPELHITREDLPDYARSFHLTAKKLAETLKSLSRPVTDPDVAPLLNLYRQALELQLKAMVLGGGGNFLETKPDRLSIYKTHSVSWLAQFVGQVVTRLHWRTQFRCEGIETLDDFKKVVESVNCTDPGSYAYRRFAAPGVRFPVDEFARRVDALLVLLESTADALEAEWDLRSGELPELDPDDGGFSPTIQ